MKHLLSIAVTTVLLLTASVSFAQSGNMMNGGGWGGHWMGGYGGIWMLIVMLVVVVALVVWVVKQQKK